jgi:hypothetical protein
MRVFKNGQLQIYFIELNTNIGICLKLKSHSIENKIYLITCTGSYDLTSRNYTHRLVLSGKLINK